MNTHNSRELSFHFHFPLANRQPPRVALASSWRKGPSAMSQLVAGVVKIIHATSAVQQQIVTDRARDWRTHVNAKAHGVVGVIVSPSIDT